MCAGQGQFPIINSSHQGMQSRSKRVQIIAHNLYIVLLKTVKAGDLIICDCGWSGLGL